MGCHTWFYKKLEISFEEVKKSVIKRIEKEIEFNNDLIYNRDNIVSDLLEAYPEWTVETGIYWKSIFERQLRMIKSGFCEKAICNKYSDYNSDKIELIYGKTSDPLC